MILGSARIRIAFTALATTFALLGASVPAHAKASAPEIYPLSKVKRGQKGYGMTVFQGTEPERFEFEVVGVLRNMLPGLDIVLVKSDDPKLKVSGFAGGMSGSPLYLDGKLMCAFSYSMAAFTITSLGGCTPIESMIGESKTPLRGQATTAMASTEEWQRYQPLENYDDARAVLARADAPSEAWLLASPLPTAPVAPATSGDDDGLQRAAVPLSIAGLGARAFEQARAVFSPYGLEPMQAGGTGSGEDSGPTKFEMGGTIGVQMMKGDMSMVGTGTATYIDGNNVLAFGHSMFMFGEIYMPTCTAEIHTILPSANRSFKLSSPLRTLGSLVQDRQSMIQVDQGKTTEMIPVDVTIKGPAGDKQFHTMVARNRFITPQLVLMSAISAAQLYYPDVADATVTVDSTLHIHGFKPLTFTDYMYSPDGAAGNAIASARALRILSPLLFNPWSNLTIDRVEVAVAVEYKADYANIVDIRLPAAEVPYGKPFDLEVTLQPFGGANYVLKIPVTLPEKLAGQAVRVDVVPGDMARLDIAQPESAEQLIDALRKTYPGNVLVVTVYTADEGATIGGKIVPNLPDSAIDTARPAASTQRNDSYKSLVRVVVPTKRVVQGRQEILMQVEERH